MLLCELKSSSSGGWGAGGMVSRLENVEKVKTIPLQAPRVPGGGGPQISRLTAREDGKLVSPKNRPPLPYH